MEALWIVVALVCLAGALAAAALRRARALRPGDPAPDFALPGSDGRVHRLADLRGRTVVLAWFPKAFTSG